VRYHTCDSTRPGGTNPAAALEISRAIAHPQGALSCSGKNEQGWGGVHSPDPREDRISVLLGRFGAVCDDGAGRSVWVTPVVLGVTEQQDILLLLR